MADVVSQGQSPSGEVHESAGRRLLPFAGPVPLTDHLDWYGPVDFSPSGPKQRDLIGEIERSGLRGKGGAGFPTAAKMAAVARHRRRGLIDTRAAVVVANGTEGEPASIKDKALLSTSPHLVLDGVGLAALAVGARDALLCIDRAATRVLRTVAAALREREAAGLDPVPIRLAATPSRYLTGEESALVHWLNGGEAKPTLVPPRPFERGVAGRPTLVQNVETLANVALIARYGSGWFRSTGTDADPGTTLLTISGAVDRPGVYEVDRSRTLAEVLAGAGAAVDDVQSVLVGGYFGTWVPGDSLANTDLGAGSLAAVRASLGCGVLVALPARACGLVESARVTRWLADQTAGQCGPCVFGLDAIAQAMVDVVHGDPGGQAEARLRRWLQMIAGRGACKHPDGAARFVASSLDVFARDLDRHRRGEPCHPGTAPLLPTPAPGEWR